jgi:Tfp pilus assembly protein PilO
LIIVISLIIASNIYKGQTNSIKSLSRQKEVEANKNEAINKIKETDKVLKSYQQILKRKDINTAINTITNIAQDNNIIINSLKPAKEEVGPIYIKYPFALSVSADSYHNIARFISKMENHSDIYFTDSLIIKAADMPGAAHRLNASIVISTVELKGVK